MRVLALVALGAAVVFATGATGTVSAAPSQGPKAVKGELIVGFGEGVSRAEQNAALKDSGATSKKRFGQIDAVLVMVKEDEEAAVMKTLASDPRIRYAEPNHVVSVAVTPVFPNDPSFSQLWGLHNTGQTGGTPDADIDAPEAWDNNNTGSSDVVVAVTDTGVDFSHPDLAAQQWINPDEIPANGQDDDLNGYVDDRHGYDFVNNDSNPVDDNNHGTHVSGTIGAVGNNGDGVVGVNWNVRIMALKFLNSAGSGTTADAIEATLYAANNGADVSSNSWGGGPYDQALLDAIEFGASRGMLFVAAAGNDSRNNDTTPTYPSSYGSADVLSVAATDHNDALPFFSNYGATSVDLAAPGVNILSTTPGNTYSSFSGTSMATPHVSGAAALVKARFPNATPYGIRALLLGSVDVKQSITGVTATNGRLNVFTAVSCDNEPKVWLEAPLNGFVAGVGDTIPIKMLGANCAEPAGLGNVNVTVNGTPVVLSASSPDGLYTGNYTVGTAGSLMIQATVSVGTANATKTITGTAFQNYTCVTDSFSWVDVTPVAPLVGADGDDAFSTLNIGFQIPFYGQSYGTAYVSSNGFLTLGSSSGATAYLNAAIPTAAAPNGVIAPFWDDLYPGATGSVHAGVSGSAPPGEPDTRALHIEWFNVPHFSLSGSGTATFEVSLYAATGEIRFQWLDTDLGNPTWNLGASATAGVERPDGVVGRQIAFNQPLLTNPRAVSCTYGAPPPPPPLNITTTTLPNGQVGQAYSHTLVATGGTLPYTWTASGSLPPGLALGANGVLSGTPTTAGPYSFTAQVTDAGSPAQTDAQALSVTVTPPPLNITTTTLPNGQVGQAYSHTLVATGGTLPYTWTASGSLPPGLALGANGLVSGTPTSAGTSNFTVQVADAGSQTDAQALSITIAAAPLTIASWNLPEGKVGVAYPGTVTASGGVGTYTWSRASGTLPTGLSIVQGAPTMQFSGVPTKNAVFSFTLRVTDSLGATTTRAFSIKIRK